MPDKVTDRSTAQLDFLLQGSASCRWACIVWDRATRDPRHTKYRRNHAGQPSAEDSDSFQRCVHTRDTTCGLATPPLLPLTHYAPSTAGPAAQAGSLEGAAAAAAIAQLPADVQGGCAAAEATAGPAQDAKAVEQECKAHAGWPAPSRSVPEVHVAAGGGAACGSPAQRLGSDCETEPVPQCTRPALQSSCAEPLGRGVAGIAAHEDSKEHLQSLVGHLAALSSPATLGAGLSMSDTATSL